MDSSILENFLASSNAAYIADLYQVYLEEPSSVDSSWRSFFASLNDEARTFLKDKSGASWAPKTITVIGVNENLPEKPSKKGAAAATISSAELIRYKFENFLNAYRRKGHFASKLDPLGLEQLKSKKELKLDPASFGFTAEELNLKLEHGPFKAMSIKEAISFLEQVYTSTLGVELEHIESEEERNWLYSRLESKSFWQDFSKEKKIALFRHLQEAENFEQFLHKKFRGDKRFSVEGGESSILATECIIEQAARLGVAEAILGMAHRGRLNTLTKIMGKPYSAMIAEFKGAKPFPDELDLAGDVKYHLGFSSDREVEGNKIHLSLTPNPSHLETVNSIVLGKVRAIQSLFADNERKKVMGVLIHGDAAFCGQGIVSETLMLGELDGYKTGGTIHIIVNNQVGFTTDGYKGHASRYPTEIAKAVQAPIFHVNGEDPETVARISALMVEYRQTFHKDAVLDIICYRKYGHNEGDEPNFTQPIMYKKIAEQQPINELYGSSLVASGVLDVQEKARIEGEFHVMLEQAFNEAQEYKAKEADWLKRRWQNIEVYKKGEQPATGIKKDKLIELGSKLIKVPAGFELNPKIARLLEAKENMLSSGEGLDWSLGEALAYASIVAEKTPIRLSGQDAGRGTFSHRHSIWRDQTTQAEYNIFNNIAEEQARFEVIDSNLSEYAVLGYEYGHSIAYPEQLAIWEAQFGDFVNGAQIIIDQYISAAESKWLRMSGLVMLLPHGYEGMGPEHSSARLERFLQLCAEDNMQVVNCTTPASFFHALRRQVKANYRKPLIVFTPKSLLRHRLAVSKLNDFVEGTSFKPLLSEVENLAADKDIARVILCSGKVYYDLYEERQNRKLEDVAIIRLEQLYPFPEEELVRELKRYPNAKIVWCQEEPQNMGPCYFLAAKLRRVLDGMEEHKNKAVIYAGRKEAASPATGFKKVHEQQQADIVNKALG